MFKKVVCTSVLVGILLWYPNVVFAETLRAGTIVPLEFRSSLSSSGAKVGQRVDLSVVSDIHDPKTKEVIIKAGTPAEGSITKLEKKGIAGKAGELALDIRSTRAVDGTVIPLTAHFEDQGDSKRGVAIGLAAVSLIVLWPLAFMIFKKGKDAEIPVGTKIDAYVRTDTEFALGSSDSDSVQAATPIRNSDLDALDKLHRLYKEGVLSQEEFEAKKKQILHLPEEKEHTETPIKTLEALHERGVLSDKEYEAKKQQLMDETIADTKETPDYLKKYMD